MPPRPRILVRDSPLFPSTSTQCLRSARSTRAKPRLSRSLSSTPAPQASRIRRQFYGWLNGAGKAFRDPLPGSTNYLNAYNAAGELIRGNGKSEDSKSRNPEEAAQDGEETEETRGAARPKEGRADLMPFPENKQFISQSVLSEDCKDAIARMIQDEGKSVREVSNLLGVSMERVGAVVRLKGVEADWVKKGKPLPTFYSKAITAMLPVTPFNPRSIGREDNLINTRFHESINDLPVHSATKEQIFFPASESRQFTRVDAGRVFEKGLLPADKRIPHPEAIDFARGQSTQESRDGAREKLAKFYETELQQRAYSRYKKAQKVRESTVKIEGDRAIFQITNITVDEHTVGKDGRGVKGVGVRYGLPHQDRKKGQIKIPTSVR